MIEKKSTFNRIDNFKGRTAKKGEIRNPHGRPRKADCLLGCIKEELTKASLLVPGMTNEQLIASVLVKMASQGNVKAIDLMMVYLHARPTQGVDVTSKGKSVTSFAFVLPDGTKVSPKQLANQNGG